MVYIVFIISILVNISLLYYELGLGAFLAVLLQLGLICYMLYKKDELKPQLGLKLFIMVLLVAPFILRDMLVFKLLTFLALPLLFSFFFIDFKDLQLLNHIPLLLDVMLRPFAKFHLFFKQLTSQLFKGRDEVKYIITGIAISIPFLIIVLPLLISSDLILESMTLDFFESIQLSSSLIFRIVFVLFFSSYWFAQYHYQQKTYKANPLVEKIRSKASIFITYTFLTIINIIYVLYVFIQVKYLFLNAGQLPEGITYATYAREGFFQLVVVTLINLGLIILLEYLNYTGQFKQRLLESFTLLMTMVMAISAFYRMSLYEQSYGYTTLRLLVFLFLIFMIVLMALLIVYIISYQSSLLKIISVFSLIVYISVSWMNLDSYVAKSNIERFEETGDIDIYYLSGLSLDAKMELLTLEENYPDLLNQIDTNYKRDDLSWQTNKSDSEKEHWQEWNIYK